MRAGMDAKFGDVLVPTEEIIEMRGGQKRRSERKFFPGYVLVQIDTHDEGGIPDRRRKLAPGQGNAEGHGFHRWHGRQSAADQGCGSRCDPAARAGRRRQAAAELLFEPGQMVRVIDGPFNDFNGVVEEVNYERAVCVWRC